jgi:MtN3 and saliva related transmembrane protein
MEPSELIGYLAAGATTASLIPQAINVVRTRDTHSISLWMYVIFTLGVALWLVYGLLLKSQPIILANVVTLFFAAVILAYKLREKKRR